MSNEKVKIKDLPSKDHVLGSDILVESDKQNTYKITVDDVASYISDSELFETTYILKDLINKPNGVVGLDSNSKINGSFVPYGTENNTAYEGSSGKVLEKNLDNHLLDDNAHGYKTKIDNLGSDIASHIADTSIHTSVRRMSQNDYDNLSKSEQENGTIYLVK